MKLALHLICLVLTALGNPTLAAVAANDDARNWCSSCDTLEELYANYIKPLIANEGTNLYVKPTQDEMDDFESVVSEMMAGASQSPATLIGTGACADIPLLSLDDKYIIDIFFDTENNKDYCVLTSLSLDWAWGTVIVNQDGTAKNLSFDSVHPRFDTNTGEQSIAVFKGTNARSFMVSGTHKYANDESSECDGTNNVSDVAHSINCFQSAAKAIMEYYDSFNLDYTAIQFHAMASTACEGVDGYFTNGGTFPAVEEKINMFRDAVAEVMNDGSTFTVPGELPFCKLTGGTNVQGRMINGVDYIDACTVKSSTYSGRFIHLETKGHLREKLPELHAKWSEAVNSAYAKFADAEPPRRTTLISPNGGETIGQGTFVPISWDPNNRLGGDEELQIAVGRINIDGSFNYVQGIAYGNTNNPYATNSVGTYMWRVRTALAEGDYVIRIRAVASALQSLLDYSDTTFSVVKSLSLTSPNGFEIVEKTKKFEIKWDVLAEGVEKVYISLHQTADKDWKSTIATVDNTGSYMWTVPASIANADDYTIRIRNTDYTYSNDYSDAFFSIIDPPPEEPSEDELPPTPGDGTAPQAFITVTSPNGGEMIGQGTLVRITWANNSLGDEDQLQISVGTIDSDGSYKYVQGIAYGGNKNPYAINSARSFMWRVRTALAPGNYVIRIRPISSGLETLQDYSDTVFTVVAPLELTSPNGGEQVVKSQPYEIKWDIKAEGVVQVYISLHNNADKAWHSTIATIDNTGSFMWTVPSSIVTADDYTIRIRNTDYTYSKDYSDAYFSIIDPDNESS